MVLLTVTFTLYYSCYYSVHLGYWHMYITIVQLASPAIHNKDNGHIILKGYENECRNIIQEYL